MKKIQLTQNPLLRALPGLCILAAAVILLSGCDFFKYKQPYADAYYNDNFIASIGFDKFVGASTTVSADAVTGQWDLAYRYASWDSYNYITLTDTGTLASVPGGSPATVPSGLSATAPVYRLVVVNLIDGGSFETDESAAWSVTGIGTATRDTSSVLFGAGSMKLDAPNGSTVVFTSTAHSGFTFNSADTYNVFFRYLSDAYSANVTITPSANTILQTLNSGAALGLKQYFAVPAQGLISTPVFTFAPVAPDSFYYIYVDNFRVGRKGNMDLRLLLTIPETTPALESGTYSFSVWVYSDPAATDVQTPFHVDAFGVKMVAAAGTGHIASSTATYAIAAGWTKLTATLNKALTYAGGETKPVIQLDLDFNATRPGSVLLAQPELRFYPDGL